MLRHLQEALGVLKACITIEFQSNFFGCIIISYQYLRWSPGVLQVLQDPRNKGRAHEASANVV